MANPKTGVVPVEATEEDIRQLVEAFAAAARRAQAAGFDGVGLHAAPSSSCAIAARTYSVRSSLGSTLMLGRHRSIGLRHDSV